MTTLLWRVDAPVDEFEELPACTSCRRRKLKCSRDAPRCYHCVRLGSECLYDSRQKPGLKTGAVENLSRRIAVLEQILLNKEGTPLVKFTADGQIIGSKLASLQNIVEGDPGHRGASSPRTEGFNDDQDSDINTNSPSGSNFASSRPKRKLDELDPNQTVFGDSENSQMAHLLPNQEILVKAVDYFCISYHHWMPFVHKARTQAEVRKDALNLRLILLLHALVAVTLRRMDREELGLTLDEVTHQIGLSTDLVMKHAMARVSLESLQALTLLVFDHLNDGDSDKAFPLIALLTRTVDFLQLTVEPGAPRSRVMMKPFTLLQPAQDWTELEARRRLFWVIFLLDRFCSAHTGWNTSLTSEDVYRRLPADGAYFTREKPVTTPFFGIWDKSFTKIGRSLAHVPAQYKEDGTPSEVALESSPQTTTGSASVDASNLGAFAYCIEATESLNQVTTFFLQQRIDWQNRQDVVDWLTRFKELDLRLVHWKMFLPPRWQDSNISSDKSFVNMDPNLTLAHMTHNTSMILLHFPVALPPAEWTNLIALPSTCSAETCSLAAIEISHIADKFLRHTEIPFVNPQFAFCAFVAAKTLLMLSQSSGKPPLPEFNYLVDDLWTMSARWMRRSNDEHYRQASRKKEKIDVAGRYAYFLERLQQKCRESSEFQFDMLDHSCQNLGHSPRTPVDISAVTIAGQVVIPAETQNAVSHSRSQDVDQRPATGWTRAKRRRRIDTHDAGRSSTGLTDRPRTATAGNSTQQTSSRIRERQSQQDVQQMCASTESPATTRSGVSYSYFSPESQSVPIPAQEIFIPDDPSAYGQPFGHVNEFSIQDPLFQLSDTLMDPQFMEMDRVITFEGANFYAPDIGPLALELGNSGTGQNS